MLNGMGAGIAGPLLVCPFLCVCYVPIYCFMSLHDILTIWLFIHCTLVSLFPSSQPFQRHEAVSVCLFLPLRVLQVNAVIRATGSVVSRQPLSLS